MSVPPPAGRAARPTTARPPDRAAQLLSGLVPLLPAARQQWGRALQAELAYQPAGRQRRELVLAGLRVLLPGLAGAALGYLAVLAGALLLVTRFGISGALRAEVLVLALVVAGLLRWSGRRYPAAPGRVARPARLAHLALLAGCVASALAVVLVVLPREGSDADPSAAAFSFGLVIVLLAGHAVAGIAVTAAGSRVPPATLAAGGAAGLLAGLGWSALLPFEQTLAVDGWWYPAVIAVVAVGLPALAGRAAGRTGGTGQAALAGALCGSVLALVALAIGWALLAAAPSLLDAPVLDKGPAWRPPDVVEQVLTSYLGLLLLAPVAGALVGAAGGRLRAAGRAGRVAAAAGLIAAALLCAPLSAAGGRDGTQFGAVGATDVVFPPVPGTLLTGNADRTWILWDVSDPARPMRRLTVTDAALVAPDGRLLASPGRLWDLTDPGKPARLGWSGTGVPVAFSADGRLLAVQPRGPGAAVSIWDVGDARNPVRVGALTGGTGRFFTAAGAFVTDTDEATIVWDLSAPARPTRSVTLPGGRPQLSPDGRTLAVTDGAGDAVLWDVADPHHPRRSGAVAGLGRDGGALTFAPDGRLLATAEGTGRVLLRDATGRRIAELPAPASRHNVQLGASDTLTTVAFDVGGRTVSVIVGNGAVARWDVSDPARPVLLGSWTRPASGNGRVAFSPDTRVVAGSATDGSNTVSIWRLPQP